MNKNYAGTYGVIKKNGGIDLICSVNYEGGGLFASILKCIDENNEYLKVIIFGNCKEESEKIVIIKKEGYEIIRKPKFDVGDKVKLIKYPDEIAIVKEIIWHEKNRRIFYILDVEENKKRSNSWYYEDENKFEKINE
ncbi:hypothetical protein KST83_12570 [Fusobacterium nucleatum]|uniref:Uncharacterized protein n=1 Tax=Fusobacterium nucleatum subsp. polymorphum TaxID=76857 RepID=A0A2C5ZA31_FUSNP|nr:hypothetical protein [Fusobacterium polymorphum]PHH96299.1 hypothetical protein CA840_02370 [Fusobacterium polymorphum]